MKNKNLKYSIILIIIWYIHIWTNFYLRFEINLSKTDWYYGPFVITTILVSSIIFGAALVNVVKYINTNKEKR